jgi:hypothetical protein
MFDDAVLIETEKSAFFQFVLAENGATLAF